jgi:hypothetical protein
MEQVCVRIPALRQSGFGVPPTTATLTRRAILGTAYMRGVASKGTGERQWFGIGGRPSKVFCELSLTLASVIYTAPVSERTSAWLGYGCAALRPQGIRVQKR